MTPLTAETAQEFVRRRGWVDAAEQVEVRELSGGVSNAVFLVHRPARPAGDFVLKQALPQLRVADPWFAPVERIWREVDVLRRCAALLEAADAAATADGPRIVVPRVLHEDREAFAFAMTAAPAEHRTWKAELLAGRADPAVAAACGGLLGRLHAGTWRDADVARQLDDLAIFDELRLDPYYREVGRRHADARPALDALVAEVLAHRRTLVHGDFSPKNLLVYPGGLMLLDFEVGHYGDPAFDLGFFLTHLALKALYHVPRHEAYLALTLAFWDAYRGAVEPVAGPEEWRALEARAARNFAGCVWARLDGKSPVEYLTDPARRTAARDLARWILTARPATWSAVVAEVRTRWSAVAR